MDGHLAPVARAAADVPGFDVERVRADFPILSTLTPRGKPLVFLDSGASAQKPRAVIEAMVGMMETAYANVHRGAYHLSEAATDSYEATRTAVARFLNAADEREIVLTGTGSTQAINLVAHSYGRGVMRPDQAVLTTEMEHHANLVPWHLLRGDRGNEVRVCRVTDDGELDLDDLEAKLADGKVGLVTVAHMSNVLGTVNPVAAIARIAHAHGAMLLVDGSQGAVHRRVDVQALGCDFYVFTSHKLYGPTGLGVLWGRLELLERMPPFLGGGDMITEVGLQESRFAPPPLRFEAGTPPILEAIGLRAAIDYIEGVGMAAIEAHEQSLVQHALHRLTAIEGVTLLGRARDRGGVFAFAIDTAHAHDVSTLLDRVGICVRSGRHCAEPLHHRFGVESTCRASFGMYTTHAEVDLLADAVGQAREFFR